MIRKKLVSKGGMTLTEVLVAVLVFALLSTVILYGTSTALRIYRKGVMASEARTLSATLIQSLSNELRYAQNVNVDGDKKVTSFDSRKYGPGVFIQSDDGRVHIDSGDKSKSYDLLGEKAYTSGLKATVDVKFDKDKGLFTIDLTVSNSYGVNQQTKLFVGSLVS